MIIHNLTNNIATKTEKINSYLIANNLGEVRYVGTWGETYYVFVVPTTDEQADYLFDFVLFNNGDIKILEDDDTFDEYEYEIDLEQFYTYIINTERQRKLKFLC
jgi:hypothetical protein